MIFPIWKLVGQSTHVLAKKISEKLGVKTAHTGTLDPMAEGVIIVLGGAERLKKYEYAKWKKTYEFEILFGIATDTYDVLGLTTAVELPAKVNKKAVEKGSALFKGAYEQVVPPYSAIKVRARPLHWYARNNKLHEIKLPKRNGQIYDIKLLSMHKKSLAAVIARKIGDIKTVYGNLRQDEIIANWEKIIKKFGNQKVWIVKLRAESSKGLYIRSLAQDICKELGTCGFVLSLVRTKNGRYTKKDCSTKWPYLVH